MTGINIRNSCPGKKNQLICKIEEVFELIYGGVNLDGLCLRIKIAYVRPHLLSVYLIVKTN